MVNLGKRIGLVAAAVLLLALAGFPAHSQDWQRFLLGEASFEVPSSWTIARSKREREYTLKSPDSVYELRVEWWLPDEPLLGYADIVGHRKIVAAGQPALLIYSKFPRTQTLQVALDKPRKDGRQLLIVLEAKGRDLKGGSALLDGILARLTLTGAGNGAPKDQQKSAAAMDPMTAHFGTDCTSTVLADWRHAMRDTLRTKGRARLEWVSVCRGGAYPVLGVAFELDPQGATSDYFNPLYLDLLAANRRRALALVSTRDQVVIKIAPRTDGGFDLDVAALEGPDVDAMVRGGDGPPVDEPVGPAPTEASAGTVTLFAGSMSKDWREIAMSGGDFKKFARPADSTLVVDVPPGNAWGKTGIGSVATVINLPKPRSTEAVALRFALNPLRARNFAISLLPAGRGGEDEWNHHQIRFAVSTKEGEASEIFLWVERNEQARRTLAGGVPAEFELQLLPDRVILLTDGAGEVLLQGTLPETAAADGYHIQAIAHAREANGPASLALKRITRHTWSFGRVDASDRTLRPGETQTSLLFDGEVTHPFLERYQAHGGEFAKHARIEGGALLVDVPQGAKWGKTGFYSRQPVVWLDGESEDAEAVTTFAFDPERTTGFVAALAPISNLNGNDPNNPRVLVHWRQATDGKAVYSIYSGYDKIADLPAETAVAPRDVKFILKRGRAKLLLPGARDYALSWPPAASGQGFRLYVYSHPDKADVPVRMALTSIVVERSGGSPVAAVKRESAPAALPVRALFDAGKPGAWDIAAVSEDLKRFAKILDGMLVVDVPQKNTDWAKSGILFREPVLDFNERIESTPFKITLRFDPKATDGLQIILSGHRIADMWGRRHASVALIRHDEGSAAGHYVLSFDADAYRTWSRRIPAEWIEANWDGTIELVFESRALTARIPGAAAVRAIDIGIAKHSRSHMVVTAHAARPYGPARMSLVSVTSQWMLPATADALDRWSFVDDADFQPSAFLDDLTRSLNAEADPNHAPKSGE